MGLFAGYVFDGSSWRDFDPASDQPPDLASRWLSAEIHDSDFAAVRYGPSGPGSGTAYLGFTPRTYFQDQSASAPAGPRRGNTGEQARALAGKPGAEHASDPVRPSR